MNTVVGRPYVDVPSLVRISRLSRYVCDCIYRFDEDRYRINAKLLFEIRFKRSCRPCPICVLRLWRDVLPKVRDSSFVQCH